MSFLLAVALGGAVGAVARYSMGLMVSRAFGSAFPYATLGVNVLGSFVMGFLLARYVGDLPPDHLWRGLLTIGFLGSFTTFSTFSLEAATMIERGQWAEVSLYIGASVLVGLAALFGGTALGRTLP